MGKEFVNKNSQKEEASSFYNYKEFNKQKEEALLEKVCKESDVSVRTVSRLIKLEMSMIGKRKRRGLQNQIDTIIQSAIMSREGDVNNVTKKSDI